MEKIAFFIHTGHVFDVANLLKKTVLQRTYSVIGSTKAVDSVVNSTGDIRLNGIFFSLEQADSIKCYSIQILKSELCWELLPEAY